MGLRAQNKDRRRGRILGAAQELVEQGGFEGLSMRKVARSAGVSVTTLYNLFGSKEEIRAALCGDLLDGIDRDLERTPLSDPLARARAVITVGVDHVVGESEAMRAGLLAAQHAPPEEDVVTPRAVEMQRVALQAGIDAGLLRDDLRADLLAAQVYQGFLAAGLLWARREVDAAGFRDRALYALYVCVLGVAADATRPALLERLHQLEPALAAAAEHAA